VQDFKYLTSINIYYYHHSRFRRDTTVVDQAVRRSSTGSLILTLPDGQKILLVVIQYRIKYRIQLMRAIDWEGVLN